MCDFRDEDGSILVPVKSRLRDQVSRSFRLAGLRVVVIDNLTMAGMRLSLCNQAYYVATPPQETTAVCIETLIDNGAMVLGRTKMSSVWSWEEPIECVDYQAPWNPRADGYQSPGVGSTGSGAAIAAYDWLDIAIGSDSENTLATMCAVTFTSC